MKFGVFGFPLRIGQLRDVAVEAEALGFDSLWVGEHLISPIDYASRYPYPALAGDDDSFHAGVAFFDPYVVFGHLAALTTTLQFAVGVSIVPLHDPYHLARSIVTVDQIAPGRITLGVGSGWLREEFDIVGRDFEGRGVRLDETLDVMERLWADEVVSYDGSVFTLPPSRFEPKPSVRPPLVFGGHSPAALRRAAGRGDGWFGVELAPAEVADIVGRLRDLRRDRPETPTLDVSVMLGLAEAAVDSDASALIRRLSPEMVTAYADAGADRLILRPWRRGNVATANLRRVAYALGLEPSGQRREVAHG